MSACSVRRGGDKWVRTCSLRLGGGCVEGGRGLTLAQKHVLRQVPEGRLHHVKVPAAHAVHEGGQEVGRQAAAEAERGDMMTPEEG